MVKYVSLIRFTDQGISAVKDSTRRARAFNNAVEGSGVKIIAQYWTIGAYDGILILEAESEHKILHYLTELASTGAVRPQTLRAFDADEFDQIVGE